MANQLPEAQTVANQVLELDPANGPANFVAGLSALRNQHFKEAIRNLSGRSKFTLSKSQRGSPSPRRINGTTNFIEVNPRSDSYCKLCQMQNPDGWLLGKYAPNQEINPGRSTPSAKPPHSILKMSISGIPLEWRKRVPTSETKQKPLSTKPLHSLPRMRSHGITSEPPTYRTELSTRRRMHSNAPMTRIHN